MVQDNQAAIRVMLKNHCYQELIDLLCENMGELDDTIIYIMTCREHLGYTDLDHVKSVCDKLVKGVFEKYPKKLEHYYKSCKK